MASLTQSRASGDTGSNRNLVACTTCDLLVDISSLRDGQSASCPRCGQHVARSNSHAFEHALAFAIASLVLLSVALTFPFLSFSASGMESSITLLDAPKALFENGMQGVAMLVGAFIIAIPAAVSLLAIALTSSLVLPVPHKHLGAMASSIFALKSWAMAEVFFIGVVVSLVKIAALASIEIGTAFWAYALFTVCQTLTLANLDRYQCWNAIEDLAVR